MTISDDYLARLQALHVEINAEHERLGRMLSTADRTVNNLYHEIERAPAFDEDSALSAMTMLQSALVRRRIIKDELKCLAPVRLMFAENIEEREKQHRRAVAISADVRSKIQINEVVDR